jgi:hypothetical protein
MLESLNALLGAEGSSFAPRLALSSVLLSVGACAAVALVLRVHFVRLASRSTGDRGQFGNTLVLVALATTLVILTIKSSLALSLGLVGALSVIRFRTPIKEPEELAYLFLAVGLGVGMGAEVVVETTVAFALVLMVGGVLLWRTRRRFERSPLALLEVELPEGVAGDALLVHLRESSLQASLVRVTSHPHEPAHWVFGVREATQGQLLAGYSRLRATWPDARISVHQTTPL